MLRNKRGTNYLKQKPAMKSATELDTPISSKQFFGLKSSYQVFKFKKVHVFFILPEYNDVGRLYVKQPTPISVALMHFYAA